MGLNVLLVEDDMPLCEVVARNLTARGHEVSVAGTADAALRELTSGSFDLMLLDIDLPDRSGWDVVRELRAQGRSVPFIVVSAVRLSPEKLAEFRPIAHLPKPFPLNSLLQLVERAVSAPLDESVAAPAADDAIDVESSLDEYDRQIESARRAATMPDLLVSEFEQRFAELAAKVIIPAMDTVETELVMRGHRAELTQEQHSPGPPAWSKGAAVTLAVLPRGWDLTGERHRLRPRLTFVGNAARGVVEVHSWIARPDRPGEGRERATSALDDLTTTAVERELRAFLHEVLGAEPRAGQPADA